MTPLVDEALERYAAGHTTPVPQLVEELHRFTREHTDAPGMQVGPVEGTFLRLLVALSGARRILEIGTFTGYSALMMASALPEDGELVTCEIDAARAALAQGFFDRSPHAGCIRIALGPALETIAGLQGPFDLCFLDADKENYPRYFEAVLPLLRRGGLLVADNVLWSGRVLEPRTGEATTAAIQRFNAQVRDDPRVEQVILTVRDGITLARRL